METLNPFNRKINLFLILCFLGQYAAGPFSHSISLEIDAVLVRLEAA